MLSRITALIAVACFAVITGCAAPGEKAQTTNKYTESEGRPVAVMRGAGYVVILFEGSGDECINSAKRAVYFRDEIVIKGCRVSTETTVQVAYHNGMVGTYPTDAFVDMTEVVGGGV